MRQMSIVKRVKDYCIEYTRTIYEANRGTTRGVNQKKLVTNLARARREIVELVRLNLCFGSSLLTLTYKENMQDYEKARKDFDKFIKRLKYHYKLNLKYIRVIELQKRGAIHFHIITFSPEFVKIPYNNIFNLWGHGAVHVRPIEVIDELTADKVGNYLGKYLTKTKDIALNKKIYSTSRNLTRQQKERIIVEHWELFEVYDEYLKNNADVVIELDYSMKKYIKAL